MPGSSYVTVRPLGDIVQNAQASWRLGATMFVAFAVLALVVAAVGLYGVIGYSVAQRMHELGVRVALGAQQRDILWLVVGQSVRFALAGTALGLIVAAVAEPMDPAAALSSIGDRPVDSRGRRWNDARRCARRGRGAGVAGGSGRSKRGAPGGVDVRERLAPRVMGRPGPVTKPGSRKTPPMFYVTTTSPIGFIRAYSGFDWVLARPHLH